MTKLCDQGENGVHRWSWACDRCEAIWSLLICSDDAPGPTITTAVVQLARLAGWDVHDAETARARCARCNRNQPHH